MKLKEKIEETLKEQYRDLGKLDNYRDYCITINRRWYKVFGNCYWNNLPIFIDPRQKTVKIEKVELHYDEDGDIDWMMFNPEWRFKLEQDISWIAYQWDKIKCKYYDFNLKLKVLAIKFKRLC